eukprot:CFRG7646T1
MSLSLKDPPKGKRKKNFLGLKLGSGSAASTSSEFSPETTTFASSITHEKLPSDEPNKSDNSANDISTNLAECSLNEHVRSEKSEVEKFKTETLESFSSAHDDIQIEDIQVLEQIGHGVSGVVEKIIHKPSGVIMARKIIHLELNPSVRKQITTELKVLHDCKSDFVVQYCGSVFLDQDLSIFMEYMDAGSLDATYKRAGVIPEEILAKITCNVLMALYELREKHKIIHRDIKPSNILINSQGQIKVCDFGVSGQLVNSIANTFVGTRSYMAPERLLGGPYAVQSDIWSLGLSIMEMAIGRFPIPPVPEGEQPPAVSIFELLEYVVKDPPPTLPEHFSENFQDFIHWCLIKDAAKRPTDRDLLNHPWIVASHSIDVNVAEWVCKTLT